MNEQPIDIVGLKNNADSSATFSLPIDGPGHERVGHLRCVDRSRTDDHELHDQLTAWRKRYAKYFLTQFEPTSARTAAWMRKVVLPSPDRILFMIQTDTGDTIGHIGISNIDAGSAELDNLIRGKKGGHPQLIYHAELATLRWIYFALDKPVASLHVFSTNRVTTALHESVGFEVHARKTLSRVVEGDEIRLFVDPLATEPLDFTYDEMRLTRDEFVKRHGM